MDLLAAHGDAPGTRQACWQLLLALQQGYGPAWSPRPGAAASLPAARLLRPELDALVAGASPEQATAVAGRLAGAASWTQLLEGLAVGMGANGEGGGMGGSAGVTPGALASSRSRCPVDSLTLCGDGVFYCARTDGEQRHAERSTAM